ncbi:EAL domain-containing protein [Chromobacterium aquaticum]|uniref:EAL domain-containing protein n=1 Tax=Chromobacterium aquaticum TaxID=467180 RepID=A0ABV8ZV16_9NEIS|nr:EAL domain-containing response regulator [Chromobacterium aquaticum]MCD5362052.1 EAL domain-containing response regulator [Chromobacterium aquaticum]
MSQILVIDDEVVSRQFLIAVLQRLGLGKVSEAVDGLDALMQLDAGDRVFDLIFCDLDMPRMDGIEFVRHLGERRYRGKLLITSGFDGRVLSSVADLARLYALCLCGVLPKPVDPVQLLALLAAPVEPGEAISLPLERLSSKELQQGIARGEVVPFFQPQVEVVSGKVLGVEVLARWQHPQLGLLSPLQFIELAEENGLITLLTKRLLADSAQALTRLATRQRLNMSINLSMQSLRDSSLVAAFVAILGDAGLDVPRVTFEVTEGGVMADPARALEILTRLRLKGAGLAIDDFGTGFASMDRLSRIPFTEMKIDKSFVIDAAAHATKRSIFEASVELGRRLGLNVVAEGVASEQEWALCRTFGVFAAQGSFISPPVDEASFSAWLAGCGGQMPLPS